MEEKFPILLSSKSLKPEFQSLQKITINNPKFTIGRALENSVVIPFLSISRKHCIFQKTHFDNWYIEDCSSFGIEVNGDKLGRGKKRKVLDKDVIKLEPSEEFVYKFVTECNQTSCESPRKRMKLEKDNGNNIINDVKLMFEASQTSEIQHIENKIQSAKQLQTTSMILKKHLQTDMNRKICQLQKDFALQINNLKGEKHEIEKQKILLLEERDAQLAAVRTEMEVKISDLMAQIRKHNETETELTIENKQLKEKLMREREEFLSELSRESTSKQEMFQKLESKIKEQEEIMLKEKKELEEVLQKEIEQLRIAKEQELKELQEQKKMRELELERELEMIKKNLQDQIDKSEQQKRKTSQLLTEKMEEMKKFNDHEKVKTEQLMKEKEEIEKKYCEAQSNAEKSLEELRNRVEKREQELAILAADRIQQQADQSSEVISSLQQQLETVKNQLKSMEVEKNQLLENANVAATAKLGETRQGESTSKESALAEVEEIMESELQCSICAELFIQATTLGCSHTFCKYCITKWKTKKKDCPICRETIVSECKSLVLDTFIEKMVQNLTEEAKEKRKELLKAREELESALVKPVTSCDNDDGSGSDGSLSQTETDDPSFELEEEDFFHPVIYIDLDGYDSFGLDDVSGESLSSVSESESQELRAETAQHATRRVSSRRAGYYGGYGRCYVCGRPGHWAPGCPRRRHF